MKRLFWNANENRLRAGWRVAIQMLWVTIPYVILGLSGFFSDGVLIEAKTSVVGVTLTVSSVVLLGIFVDKRKLTDFGVRLRQKRWWQDYLIGILGGVVGVSAYVLVLWLGKWADVGPTLQSAGTAGQIISKMLLFLAAYMGVGLFEELMRIYQVRNLAEGFTNSKGRLFVSLVSAVLIAALYSVVMHLANPNPYFLTYVFITTSIYSFFYLWTGRSGLAMGMHFAWDFAASCIFSLGSMASPSYPAFFYVLYQTPTEAALNKAIFLGVAGKLAGLLVVLLWLKLRDGKIKLNPALTQPTLKDR
ncbi:MAG: CPBP family intramembrane metalloprotease [Anaerolineaceae bacterium]|nr:CPBP family intramembrane metalloprotease [Anaerolineaceae bacterium]